MVSIKVLLCACLLTIFVLSQQSNSPNLALIEPIYSGSKSSRYPINSRPNNYELANTVFNAQAALGDYCNRCKSLKYIAFRRGNSYVTAFTNNLKFVPREMYEPNNAQLFEGIQIMDGSWAFRSKTENKFLRADKNGVTIDYQTFIGPWERWWIERHQGSAHCHIQSAQFSQYYWIFGSEGVLQQTQGATGIILEFWPDLNWGWNW